VASGRSQDIHRVRPFVPAPPMKDR
jgi:hypothetical protein